MNEITKCQKIFDRTWRPKKLFIYLSGGRERASNNHLISFVFNLSLNVESTSLQTDFLVFIVSVFGVVVVQPHLRKRCLDPKILIFLSQVKNVHKGVCVWRNDTYCVRILHYNDCILMLILPRTIYGSTTVFIMTSFLWWMFLNFFSRIDFART